MSFNIGKSMKKLNLNWVNSDDMKNKMKNYHMLQKSKGR